MTDAWIVPAWPAPANVRALSTTRAGGVGVEPFDSLNLGTHVGDDPAAVAANRVRLRALLPAEPGWLNQVHGTAVVDLATLRGVPDADGAVSRKPGAVCVVMTADCLPVLLCDRAQATVKDFPNSPATEEALFVMAKSYDALNMPELRDDADRVMRKNFPNSRYLGLGLPDDKARAPWWKMW